MKTIKLLTFLMIIVVVFAGCAPTAAPTQAPAEPTKASAEPTKAAAEPTKAPAESTKASSLADVCPNPVVIQTDWFPEGEHGAMYEMVGDNYTVDTSRKAVRGSLVASGKDTGVEIEVRTGGPAIGFQQPIQQMYVEPDIFLSYINTNEAIFGAVDTPTVAVVAPLEINPQIIMWDPATYPNVKTIADLGKTNATILVFGGGSFNDVLVAEGLVKAEQFDTTYDGSPARWIASKGTIAQQGFASAEPYVYQYELKEWGKPVAYQLLHDAGYQIYPQAVAVRASDMEKYNSCLELLVPIIQQAAVDYITAPERANAIIVDTVAKYNDFWVYSPGLAEYSAKTQRELGLVGNGPDATLGNMDVARIQNLIDKMIASGLDVKKDLKAEEILTNKFIDPSIGLR